MRNYEGLQKSKDLLKDCFQNVNIPALILILFVWFEVLRPNQFLYGHVKAASSPDHTLFLGKLY